MTPDEAAEVAIPFVYSATTSRARIDEDFAIRLANPTSPEGYTNQLLGVVGWQGAFDRLGQIRVPTLVIAGRDDRLVNPENSKILANAIDGAQLVLVDDASHVFFTDQPEATNAALIDFLGDLA
jgi:pimeloyl-ACP methyl ester carboxylesterase